MASRSSCAARPGVIRGSPLHLGLSTDSGNGIDPELNVRAPKVSRPPAGQADDNTWLIRHETAGQVALVINAFLEELPPQPLPFVYQVVDMSERRQGVRMVKMGADHRDPRPVRKAFDIALHLLL